MQIKLVMKSMNKHNSWHNFIKLCSKLKTEKQWSDLFDTFFTNAEKEDVAARYEIIRELLIGKKTQREIAAKLKISIAKISRGSNALKIADKKTKEILNSKF